jgi:L-glyceraldehyde 3-phosphate reductase
MLDRWMEEDGLLDYLEGKGIGCIVFSPLEQGLLTDKYLRGIPAGSRASKPHGFLKPDDTEQRRTQIVRLNDIAVRRGQLAIAWVPARRRHSALIGASRVGQIEDCVAALDNLTLANAELREIDEVLGDSE